MPVSIDVIKKADSDIVTGAKRATGITTSDTYHAGAEKKSTQYLALLLFGYEAQDYINTLAADGRADAVETLLKWVYGSEGSGSMDGLKDAPAHGLLTPEVHFYDGDNLHVYQLVNQLLEKVAVPTPKDIAADAIKNIIDSMESHTDWYSAGYKFASSLVSLAHNIVYPYMAVRLLGFLPKNSAWPNGYNSLAGKAVAAADEVMSPRTLEAYNAASFIIQCTTLKELADAKGYTLSNPDSNNVAAMAEMFTKFIKEGNRDSVEKMKEYLAHDYNHMDFGQIANTWNTLVEGTGAAPEETPAVPPEEIEKVHEEPHEEGPAIGASTTPAGDSSIAGAGAESAAETPSNTMPNGLDRRSYTLLQRMAVDEDQLMQALEYVTSGKYYGIPFLTTYQPGLTEKAIIQLLDRFTDKASHRRLTGEDADPRERKTIMIPPAFKVDQSQAIWTKAVVTDLGFPFINFTSPPIMELIRGTDPKSIKAAYKQVKGMFKRCGLKKPIDTLKEFAHSQYRNCALNSLVVDADTIFDVEPGQAMTVSIVDPYNPKLHTKGSFSLPIDFATAFYGVLSPVKAARQYSELCGMSTAEYMDYLADHGKPPVYVLTPKRAAFKRGPKGSLLHELFSSKTKPILVRSRVGNHDGGFMIPERVADLLFSV
jgi:hypothetical protein